MTFPGEPLGVRVELNIGSWVDITGDVLLDPPVEIQRGRPDEAAQADPAVCRMRLRNTAGKYSPRNPRSPYFGQIGRNTPLRVYVPYGDVALTNLGTGQATCPAPATAITGDLDVRVEATADDWASGGGLVGRYRTTGNHRSWALYVGGDDRLTLAWSPDGTLAARRVVSSTVTIPLEPGRRALRATLDADNGTGGHTVRFYTADSMAGLWAQLGDAVTTTGTTSVHAGTAPVEVGELVDLDGAAFAGRYHRVEVRNGIDGALVASPDFTAQTPGAAAFADAQGNVWTLQGATALDRRTYRFHGEVSAWPPRWHPGGHRHWVDIEAAGILRRLRQGGKALKSALTREIGATSPYTAWWPLEDGTSARQAAPGYGNVAPLSASGDVSFGVDPVGGTGGGVAFGSTGRLVGRVPRASGGWVVAAWYTPPDPTEWAPLHVTPILRWSCPDSAAPSWDLYGGWDGSSVLVFCEVADGTSTIIASGGGAVPDITAGDGLPIQFLVRAVQAGADIAVTMQINGSTVSMFTVPGATVAPVDAVGFNYNLAPDHGAMFLGSWSHLIVAPSSRYGDVVGHVSAGKGYSGETALERAARVAAEEGIPLSTIGDDSQRVGPQGIATALDLIGEAVDADLGVMHERLTPLGLVFRSRSADYDTAPTLALTYADLAPPLEPVDDDQAIRNDVTVERVGGSTARAVDETGPLSVNAPPAGIGRYDTSLTLNVADDTQLGDLASWLLHLGTWDEARYPVVRLDLADDPHLIDGVLTTDIRSRITIDELPEWLPPGPVDLLVEGYVERLGVRTWEVEYTCSPGSPWQVATADDALYGHVDTDGSELAAAVTATATALTVATTAGPVWTTDPADPPFDVIVGGEVMTVTAITGTSSPQTFTVVRAVNGITKPHAAGADVRLAHPAIVAL